MRLILLTFLQLIIQLTINQRGTEHLTHIINDLDLVVKSIDRMVVRFGFQEIQQLKFLIEILAGPRQVNAIVLEVDYLDVEKLFQDLQLGFLCKQPADHVIDCLFEIADERIGVGRQIQ